MCSPISLLIFHSTKPWGECCDLDDYKPPKLYGRLTATDSTREKLRAEGKVLEDVLDSTRIRYPKDIPKDFEPKTSVETANKSNNGDEASATTAIGGESTLILSEKSVETREESSVDTKNTAEIEREKERAQYKESLRGYDFPFCCQSSWASHSFKLWPGEYILSVYVEESRKVQKRVVKGMKVHKKKKTEVVLQKEERTGETPREVFVDMDLSEKGAWAHISSVGNYTLNSVTPEEMEENKYMLENTSLIEIKEKGLPLEEMGPFMSEHQHEASSKGMMDVVCRARTEVDELNVQMLELNHGQVVSVLMNPD